MERSRIQGFQLVEVVVAGFVFFLVSFFVLNLLPSSVWAVSKTETRLSAQDLAVSTLEELKVRPFESLTMGQHPGQTVTVEGVELTSSYLVAPIEHADPDLVKDVTVTVTWTIREQVRDVEARTYISRLRN